MGSGKFRPPFFYFFNLCLSMRENREVWVWILGGQAEAMG